MSQTQTTQEIYIVGNKSSGGKVYHTKPDCRALKHAHRPPHQTHTIPLNRRLCKYCDPTIKIDFTNNHKATNTTCRCCGQALNPDGSCSFCEQYHDIMGEFA